MKLRAGLLLDERAVTLAVVSGRGPVECLTFDADENAGALIAAELDTRGYKRRRLRLGLDRSLAVVKILELPRSETVDMGQMIRFELERHVPFPPRTSPATGAPIPRGTAGPCGCSWPPASPGVSTSPSA